ncbi:hypothetical protein K7X08_005150 [Anisodus acutangulus]|uniref:Uncharacterized protein n=1 Tax=Anisodus acutangulus TaxID=402998 RepID=A0A9Q1MIN3_9SOLA|nr:hypothetical protein K7X08_005150 [Anisodus acutangulus]
MASEKSFGVQSTSVILVPSPTTRSMFTVGGLERSKCFISLEMLDKNKLTITTARSGGNTSFSSPGEENETYSSFYKSEDLVDSSNVVSVMMTNAINVEEQLAVMIQIVETLRKSVEEKDLQIAKLMNKLELCGSGDSSRNPTPREKDVESTIRLPNDQSANQVVSVATDGIIITDDEDIAEINNVNAYIHGKKSPTPKTQRCKHFVASLKIGQGKVLLQFGSFEQVEVSILKKTRNTFKLDGHSNNKDGKT